MSLDLTGFGAIFDFGSKVLERVIPDPAARAAAQEKLLELTQQGELAHLAADTQLAVGQLEVNKVEAANANLFVSGWRPFIGWVCGFALAYEFFFRAFLIYIPSLFHWTVDAPELNTGDLFTVLTAILGLGSMRTVEKKAGVATSVNGLVLPPLLPAAPPQVPQPVDAVAGPAKPEIVAAAFTPDRVFRWAP